MYQYGSFLTEPVVASMDEALTLAKVLVHRQHPRRVGSEAEAKFVASEILQQFNSSHQRMNCSYIPYQSTRSLSNVSTVESQTPYWHPNSVTSKNAFGTLKNSCQLVLDVLLKLKPLLEEYKNIKTMNVLTYPYESPAQGSPVNSMEDALKLARALVKQQQVGGVKTAEEAKNIAAKIMQQYLHKQSPQRGNWDAVPTAALPTPHYQVAPQSLDDYSPQLSGSSGAVSGNSANISKPVSPLSPRPITNDNWHPESAKALEDYVESHVNYYEKVVKPPAKTYEDQLCDQLSIALFDSVYLESRKPSMMPVEKSEDRKVCPLLQKVCVSSHNTERSRVRFPAVQTDVNLAMAATRHADYCLKYGEAYPDVELNLGEGQNVMQINGSLVGQLSDGELFQMAMDHWMQEARSRKNMENYSQLMCRKATHIGASVARGKLKAFIVCNYNAKAEVV